ncbi:hypothetical protein [Sulfolobus islandicus rod-shaped virus 4]|uniref:C2H2-type domain-containing protein n=1 Tax=Sulfolobus islandicus rod-shaped virus 4 TaxID=1983547 RepID=A0A1X9SJY3_9VIRU|nr:hypothetical protein CCL46_gp18 [Sulfolobus islandicus rod-shaped virus 4]ARQ96534.1 hypothetical protein [Sulfolobus islandicus rod-shaped virus 4]
MTLKNHMGIFLFECPVCQHLTRTRKAMITHLKTHHQDVKISDCKRISKTNYEYVETKVEDND